MKRKMYVMLVCAVAFTSIVACGKRKQEQEATTEVSSDNNDAETSNNELTIMADEAAQETAKFESYSSDCVKITKTLDTTTATKFITIDFGPTNCLCADGKMRRGIVNITQKGKWNEVGSTLTIVPKDYFVEDNQVIGTRTTTCTAPFTHNIVADAQIVKSDGTGTIYWTCNKTRTQVEGTNTPGIKADNAFQITGTASGTTAKGINFTMTIDTPLYFAVGCRWIKSGVVTIKREGKDDATLDYGAGDCDAKANIKVGNKTKEITLRGK